MEFAGEREQGMLCPTLVTMHAEFEAPFPSHLLSNPHRLEKECWLLLLPQLAMRGVS